jgi:hypothetical protein
MVGRRGTLHQPVLSIIVWSNGGGYKCSTLRARRIQPPQMVLPHIEQDYLVAGLDCVRGIVRGTKKALNEIIH